MAPNNTLDSTNSAIVRNGGVNCSRGGVNGASGCGGRTLPSLLYKLFLTSTHTDVLFTFPGNDNEGGANATVPSHSLVLVAASPVFEAMLSGPLKPQKRNEDGQLVVNLEDDNFGKEAFILALEHIYTSFTPPPLTTPTPTLLQLLYLGEKYDLQELKASSVTLLKERISAENCIEIYEMGLLLNDKELADKSEEWIVENFHRLMDTSSHAHSHTQETTTTPLFVKIPFGSLLHFLSLPVLSIPSELELFECVLKWGEYNNPPGDMSLSRNNPSGDNNKSLNNPPRDKDTHLNNPPGDITTPTPLSLLLHQIRFIPHISAFDFSLKVIPSGVLPPEEALLLLQQLVLKEQGHQQGQGSLPLIPPYNHTPRRPPNYIQVLKFGQRLTENTYPYVSNISYFDSLSVSGKRKVELIYIAFPAPNNTKGVTATPTSPTATPPNDPLLYEVSVLITEEGESRSTVFPEVTKVVGVTGKVIKFLLGGDLDPTPDPEMTLTPAAAGVVLEPEKVYKISYKLKGPDTHYADQRVEKVVLRGKEEGEESVVRFIAYSCRLVEVGVGIL